MNKNDNFYNMGFLIGEIIALPFKLVLGCLNLGVMLLIILLGIGTVLLCIAPFLLMMR